MAFWKDGSPRPCHHIKHDAGIVKVWGKSIAFTKKVLIHIYVKPASLSISWGFAPRASTARAASSAFAEALAARRAVLPAFS